MIVNPAVMYGSELADYLEEIFTKVPLYDDPDYFNPIYGIHCYSKNRDDFEFYDPYLSAGALYYLREEHPCDLFVFAAAVDKAPDNYYHPEVVNHKRIFPVPNLQVFTIDEGGNSSILWNDEEHFYHTLAGTVGWEFDFKPWGSPVFNDEQLVNFPDDYEIYTTWEDGTIEEVPDCRINPYCPPHPGWLLQDYNRTELVFEWWNLTEVLAGKENYQMVDIRVIVEDEVVDPDAETEGFCYNWRRSENIMEQVCGGPGQRQASYKSESCGNFYATLRFVADNERDYQSGDEQWKIYNYSGNTTDYVTSLISRRDDNGETQLHLVVMAETSDHITATTRAEIDDYFDETMDVNFLSHEVLPYGMYPSRNIARGLAVRYDLCTGDNALPENLDFDKMEELFYVVAPPDISCMYTFYYIKLIVTDNQPTSNEDPEMNEPPVLYVSSRDHLLGAEESPTFANMLDYSESVSVDGEGDSLRELDAYGKIRGIGYFPSGKSQWYGYEEYLINGGFEVVSVDSIDECFTLAPRQVLPYVPVQSESDVIMIHGHGAVDKSNSEREVAGIEYYKCNEYRPEYETLPTYLKDTWNANMQLFLGTELMGSFTDYMRTPDITAVNGEFNKYPDFDASPYSWGNFWAKGRSEENIELRWLVLIGCTNLSDLEPERPDKNWQKVIREGYVQSVCGFSGTMIPGPEFVLAGSSPLTSKYSEYLKQLVNDPDTRQYNPGNERFINGSIWDADSKTTDNNIAAWMEAAWMTIFIANDPKTLIETYKAHTASAIDADNKWYIDGAIEFVSTSDESKMKIFKKTI